MIGERDLLKDLLAFFQQDRYRAAHELNYDALLSRIDKADRTQILRVLSMPGVELLEKHPESGRRDSAYRLTPRGAHILAVLRGLA